MRYGIEPFQSGYWTHLEVFRRCDHSLSFWNSERVLFLFKKLWSFLIKATIIADDHLLPERIRISESVRLWLMYKLLYHFPFKALHGAFLRRYILIRCTTVYQGGTCGETLKRKSISNCPTSSELINRIKCDEKANYPPHHLRPPASTIICHQTKRILSKPCNHHGWNQRNRMNELVTLNVYATKK
ncbi:unnamed protein product [Albugo candida]|uniref:Uncharacterized protein n=1 Tax=Albugo candida TaxID=65357 RepID=A0A024GUY6_9STRA|nr:unnamed protein product [Albugo candida]|eukprot:CCI50613.1 unnamed protein product [Albugo candida]